MDDVTVFFERALEWLQANILTVAALSQLAGVAGILCLASVLADRINRIAPQQSLLLARLRLTPGKIFYLAAVTLLLWLAVALARLGEAPAGILHICASLSLAWCVIRFGAGLIRSEFWAQIIGYCIGLVAGLEILGLLQPLLGVLDHMGVTIGRQRFSLLLTLKGLIACGGLLWLGSILNDLVARALQRSKSVSPSQKVMLLKVTRVITITLALLVGLNAAGLDLTVLAVFGGAIGIGVGFGLQRIFANLVSGFILLLDRSIKPGDVISVMDTYGWVNRLGARYVSILTRDGKEHLIPNEKLITEQVENWSYSDDKVRVHIPVTVSYDADIHQVKDLLLEAATANPRILPTPKPVCLLLNFGENGVNFDVRVWIRDPVNGIANVRSSFYFTIWDKFRERGIRFPYPQRDVHLKLPNPAEL